MKQFELGCIDEEGEYITMTIEAEDADRAIKYACWSHPIEEVVELFESEEPQ